MDRKPKYTFLQSQHTDGQHAHAKILHIANHWRNANQEYNEVSPHTSQKSPSLISLQKTNAIDCVEKREPSCTAGGYVNWCRQYEGSSGN